MKLVLLWPVRWYLRRTASRIEARFPEGYPPGSFAAEYRRFAENLRNLAEGLR